MAGIGLGEPFWQARSVITFVQLLLCVRSWLAGRKKTRMAVIYRRKNSAMEPIRLDLEARMRRIEPSDLSTIRVIPPVVEESRRSPPATIIPLMPSATPDQPC